MNPLQTYLTELPRRAWQGWRDFWFTPTDPATLSLIRILGGGMLFYTHVVWTLDFQAFFGNNAWLSSEAVEALTVTLRRNPSDQGFMWSYFWLIDSPALLWTVHLAALTVFALLTMGCFTRPASILAYFCAVSYVNRVPGALFGLDQINVMLAMYLMVGHLALSPANRPYSVDRWRARRRLGIACPGLVPSISANVGVRLIQLHMCVIYLFAGLSKLGGPEASWWRGDAMWLAFANLEYQSIDMTWIADWPLLFNFLTHLTIIWEVSYFALVWPRWTRPLVIAMAIPLHLGIAFCLGMMTFGLAMLIANLAFVSPAMVRYLLDRRPNSNLPPKADTSANSDRTATFRARGNRHLSAIGA